MAGVLIFVLVLALYFLPSILGKDKRNAGAIFVLNLFLGWTLVGWVVALVWALTVDTQAIVIAPGTAPVAPAPPSLFCTNCRASLRADQPFCHACGTKNFAIGR